MDRSKQVEDRTTPARGVLPTNIRTIAILAVAGIIMAVAFLSPRGDGSIHKDRAPSPTPTTDISDHMDRLRTQQAEQERLNREMARLSREMAETQSALLAPTQESPVDSPPFGGRYAGGRGGGEIPPIEDDLAQERRKRAYSSLFSSPVALSYRRRPNVAQVAQEAVQAPASEPAPSDGSIPADLRQAAGKEHVVYEGTVLECVLANRINADFSGPVIAQTTTDLYSRGQRHLLVPAGSRVLGEARRAEVFGQTRVAVAFNRLIMPDGYSVHLEKDIGLDGLGDSALKDKVNNHYFRIFGASVAVGALGGLSAFGTRTLSLTDGVSAADTFRQGAAGGLGNASAEILSRFLNVLPTITIREGHRLRIFLTHDLRLPAYETHTLPDDL